MNDKARTFAQSFKLQSEGELVCGRLCREHGQEKGQMKVLCAYCMLINEKPLDLDHLVRSLRKIRTTDQVAGERTEHRESEDIPR